MAYHTTPLEKVKEQGEMPLSSLGPIPASVPSQPRSHPSLGPILLRFFNGMGPRLGNCISPCLFTFLRGGVWQAIPKPFCFGENILLLVYINAIII